jgi:hypothetical protein
VQEECDAVRLSDSVQQVRYFLDSVAAEGTLSRTGCRVIASRSMPDPFGGWTLFVQLEKKGFPLMVEITLTDELCSEPNRLVDFIFDKIESRLCELTAVI